MMSDEGGDVGNDKTGGNETEWIETNRKMWDERVPIHVGSRFYDVDGFRAGRQTLQDFELEALGNVSGRSLVHLQCHFGLDSMSWARLGADVTGLDFSSPAVDAANTLARELDLNATFAQGNVYDAPEILGRRFDIVYTGLGALCWLPDIERWADVITALVKPGGTVFVSEFHPLTDALGDDELVFERPYFQGAEPTRWDEPGTYADFKAGTEQNVSYEWTHPVSEVIDSLARRGMILESFKEHDFTLFQRWKFLERSEGEIYRLPAEMPSIPLMYSVRLRAPRDV